MYEIKSEYRVHDDGIEVGVLQKEYHRAVSSPRWVGYVPGGDWWTFYADQDDYAGVYWQHAQTWKTLREAKDALAGLRLVRP
jgi:hypothetical protein